MVRIILSSDEGGWAITVEWTWVQALKLSAQLACRRNTSFLCMRVNWCWSRSIYDKEWWESGGWTPQVRSIPMNGDKIGMHAPWTVWQEGAGSWFCPWLCGGEWVNGEWFRGFHVGIVLGQMSLVWIFNSLSNEPERIAFCKTRTEIENIPVLLFCFSKMSEPNPRHVRPPLSSN